MYELAMKLKDSVIIRDEGPWMLPEITNVPTGSENGTVLVIGIGGSTLRLSSVCVGNSSAHTKLLLEKLIPVVVKSSGVLFDWSVGQVSSLLHQHSMEFGRLPLAVSWSFPLVGGKTVCMGKSFGAMYENVDVKSAFNEALSNRSLSSKFRISSVTHDGTSSLVAGVYQFPSCGMALTLGTGVNINLRLSDDRLINTEISMLGRSDTTPEITLPKQFFDITDSRSQSQPFEAQVGGIYLGELVSNAVGEPVSTKDLWQILEHGSDWRHDIVIKIVGRAAELVAAAIYGLLLYQFDNPSPSQQITVAYTGGVIFEPQFRSLLENKLHMFEQIYSFKVNLVPQRYGSEVGAAISALTSRPASYNLQSIHKRMI